MPPAAQAFTPSDRPKVHGYGVLVLILSGTCELLKIVKFEPGDPHVLRPEGDGEEVYETPIEEFRLSRFVLAPGAAARTLPADAPQILLCTAGFPHLGELTLVPGDSVWVKAGEKAELSGTGTVFRATVLV